MAVVALEGLATAFNDGCRVLGKPFATAGPKERMGGGALAVADCAESIASFAELAATAGV